jgi:hypothetical protein
VEEHYGGFEHVGQDPHAPAQSQSRGFRVIDLPGAQLLPAHRRLGSQVQVAVAHCLPGHTPGTHQPQQRLLALHVQDGLEFAGVVAGFRRRHQFFHGRHQGAEPREPHRPE